MNPKAKQEFDRLPKVKTHLAMIVPGHELLDEDRFVFKHARVARFMPIIAFFGPLLISILALDLVDPTGRKPIAFAITFFGFLVAILTTIVASRFATFIEMKALRPPIWDAITSRYGALPTGARYVGVSFAEDVWYVNQESSWDFGAMDIGPNGIEFLGRKVNFRISPSQIVGCEIRRHSRFARAYVQWMSETGTIETVSVEPRDVSNVDQLFRSAGQLRDDILATRDLGDRVDNFGTLPPRSSEMPLTEPPYRRASKKARVYGFIFILCLTLTLLIFTEIAFLVLAHRHTAVPGICFMPIYLFGYPVSVSWFERMFQEEGQTK